MIYSVLVCKKVQKQTILMCSADQSICRVGRNNSVKRLLEIALLLYLVVKIIFFS